MTSGLPPFASNAMPLVKLSTDAFPPDVCLMPSASVQTWMVTALSVVMASATAIAATAISDANAVPSRDAYGTSCNASEHALAVAVQNGAVSFTL